MVQIFGDRSPSSPENEKFADRLKIRGCIMNIVLHLFHGIFLIILSSQGLNVLTKRDQSEAFSDGFWDVLR
jgi:hypothetical protein